MAISRENSVLVRFWYGLPKKHARSVVFIPSSGRYLFAQVQRDVQGFGGGFIGVSDRMGVNVRCGGGLCVAQALCNGGYVGVGCDED